MIGYDAGPADYLDEEVELTEAHTLEQAVQRRAHHDAMGKIHQYAGHVHEQGALDNFGKNPGLEKYHAVEAAKHYDKSEKHDRAWEKAHDLVSKLRGI